MSIWQVVRDCLAAVSARLFPPQRLSPQDLEIVVEYKLHGQELAMMHAFSHLGFNAEYYEELIRKWLAAEKKYSEAGFRTVGLWTFISCVRRCDDIERFIGKRRAPDEEPVLYAPAYLQRFCSSTPPNIIPPDAPPGAH